MYPRKTVFKRRCQHIKTTISRLRSAKVWNYEFLSGIPVCAKPFSFMWDQLEKRSRKRDTSRPIEENNEAYVELRGKIKSAKAQLAKLDESASGEAGTSKKSKKTQEAAAANDQVAPALRAEIEAELSSAQEAAAEAKNRAEHGCQ
jgi:hypothetical protein